MTAVYDRLGLKFMYPENWKLIDQADEGPPHAITLETPDGSCTWAVHAYPPESVGEEIMKETLSTLQETYDDLEVSPFRGQLGTIETNGVETLFYCLDFLIRARLVIVPSEEYLLLFWSQAEDREFDKQDPIFQAMSFSLLQSLTLVK